MSDLLYSVGVDPTDLNTGVAAVDARLEAAGVRWAEQPRKFAKASAEAFLAAEKAAGEWAQQQASYAQKEDERLRKRAADSAAVFQEHFAQQERIAAKQAADYDALVTAEGKVAAFRKQTAFERLTDEEKLSVLRHEAHGLLTRINSEEGRTAEKANLTLQYEQKKNQIYALNQKIAAATAVEIQKQTVAAAAQPGIWGKVSAVADTAKKGFAALGMEVKGLGFGVAIAAFTRLAKEAIADAQKLRDELAAANKPIDTATRSMAALGDGISDVRKAAVTAVGFIVSGYTQLGDMLGSAINRMRGISEAEENIAMAAQRAADAAEARAKKLKEEQHDVERVAAARKAADEAERRRAFDKLTDEQKLQALLEENFRIREQIRNTEADTVAFHERRKLLVENENKLAEIGAKIKKDAAAEQKAAADERAKAEAAAEKDRLAAAEQQKQKEAEIAAVRAESLALLQAEADERERAAAAAKRQAIAEQQRAAHEAQAFSDYLSSVTTGAIDPRRREQIQAASDAELRELRKRVEAQIAAIDAQPKSGAEIVSGGFGRKLEKIPLTFDLSSIEQELALRENIRRDASIGGYDQALKNFKGDPLAFDRLFQEFVKGGGDDREQRKRTTSALEDIQRRLKRIIPEV